MNPTLKILSPTTLWLLSGILLFAQTPAPTAPAPAPASGPQERVAALKASVAASKALLKQYEWVETTTLSVKGEEKSSRMSRCYYGADGKVQKVPITTPPPATKKRGIRGRIAETKKEELTDYMKEAIALIKQYVPLDEARIQTAKEAGKVSVTPLPDQRVRLTLTDYVKPGDSVALDCDLANNRPLQAKISTSLAPQNPVTLDVRFDKLDNNATYPATATLNAPAKDLTINMQNSGYRKAGT